MTGLSYVALCLIAPGAWGVAMYFVFSAIDRRSQRKERPARPPVDYSI